MPKEHIYRGVKIEPNFRSIHGTGARLKAPRGWNVTLPGYGYLGWFSSMASARDSIDHLYWNGSPAVMRALAAANKE